MAYKISTTHQFEKDLKRCIKRGYPMDRFRTVIQLLERDGCLPELYRPHKLTGDRQGQWECHIQPDWLANMEAEWQRIGITDAQHRHTLRPIWEEEKMKQS